MSDALMTDERLEILAGRYKRFLDDFPHTLIAFEQFIANPTYYERGAIFATTEVDSDLCEAVACPELSHYVEPDEGPAEGRTMVRRIRCLGNPRVCPRVDAEMEERYG